MRKYIAPFLLLLLTFTVFHSWFGQGLVTSNDFLYYSPLMIKTASFGIYAWDWHVGLDGFARFVSPYSWIFPLLFYPQVILGKFGFDWNIIERVIYLYPLLILLICSPILLTKFFFPKNKFYLFTVLIFAFNTYALLLAGGEIFLALAYSLIPIILVLFVHLIAICNREGTRKYVYPILTGLIVAIQIMIDPRFTYETMFIIISYFLFYCFVHIRRFHKFALSNYIYDLFFIFLIPGIIASLLHAFWIIPSVLYGKNPIDALGAAYSTTRAVNYFSFAKFENTISLLHPNWPENIFGKVYFMRPKFLLVPVFAFSSLFFLGKLKNTREKMYILYFSLLALIGGFLAKGANQPFGEIYLWSFTHVPGFIMFRDPAKWYPLVAVSYSILIPFSLWKFYGMLAEQQKSYLNIRNLRNIFLILVTLYFVFLIKPAIFGQLGGMFQTTNVPKDYTQLESFLVNQPNYFRTVWFPSRQRFGFYSQTHPEISAQVLFNSTDDNVLFKKLSQPGSEKLLQEAAVRYVIVPYDSQGEIFLNDRKYDARVYLKTIKGINSIGWLKKVNCCGRIAVFEVPNPKDHFWSPNGNLKVDYSYINPVDYRVSIINAQKSDILVFSEKYDRKWIAKSLASNSFVTRKQSINSSKFNGQYNGFILPSAGSFQFEVYYIPQNTVNIGIVISAATLICTLFILVFFLNKKE